MVLLLDLPKEILELIIDHVILNDSDRISPEKAAIPLRLVHPFFLARADNLVYKRYTIEVREVCKYNWRTLYNRLFTSPLVKHAITLSFSTALVRRRDPSPRANPSSDTSEDEGWFPRRSGTKEGRQNALRGVFESLLRLRPDVQALARDRASSVSGQRLPTFEPALSPEVFASLRTVTVDDFSMALLLPYLSIMAPALDHVLVSAHHPRIGFQFTEDEIRDAHAAFSYLAEINDRPRHNVVKRLRSLTIDGFGPRWIVTLLESWDVRVNELRMYSYVDRWEADDEEVIDAIADIASNDLYLHIEQKVFEKHGKGYKDGCFPTREDIWRTILERADSQGFLLSVQQLDEDWFETLMAEDQEGQVQMDDLVTSVLVARTGARFAEGPGATAE